MDRMELPVNNFLKTLKEIESEFFFFFLSHKNLIKKIPKQFLHFQIRMKKRTQL